MRVVLAAGIFAALFPLSAARADPIVLFDDFVTADATIAAPAGVDASLAGPLGLVGGLQSGPIAVVAPGHGALLVSVTDQGYVGDVFQVLADGTALGTTAAVPVGGPDNSTGNFTVAVNAGAHTVDLWDFVLSFIGSDSPYGGAVDDTFSPADVEVAINFVPEPGGAALLAFGLLTLATLVAPKRASRRVGISSAR